MTHAEIFNLQEQIDLKLNAAKESADVDFWMEYRVIVCKWLDKSCRTGYNGLPDNEMAELDAIIADTKFN